MTNLPSAVVRISRTVWRDGVALETSERASPAETAIAIVYDGGTEAVMMASPQDVEDFAIGFSLTEGIIGAPEEIESLEIVEHADAGLEARMWLKRGLGERLGRRRRNLAGPTGCGLCGIDSLEQAVKPARRVEAERTFSASEIHEALEALSRAQALNHATRAVHAAGFFRPETGLIAVREDVGRHNALDKLAGALARAGEGTEDGFVVLTSRVSVEMIQKAAVVGVGLVVAVSAPTALGVRMADEAGITLAAIARSDGFEVFTHHHRIIAAEPEKLAAGGAGQ
ncbi:formate dehydrogenase accessory sulfurtransferase FdhD [Hansschlegelia beijingensis]|uniref:Sulfur carrier protein FdhD n=1 Tax=Hansschlegelia beijingensis TaxID=1133344 RepID=A0A7W6D1R4_9HYPH|nr:formate dehydrogenase accessory sulfurtransferase FdhD [Hansschlegelia beijingensis]MBB3972492.1 FdhD protein [Hansschlegelia beijingensis]